MRFFYDSTRKMESLPPPDKKKRTEINKRANARRDPTERNPHFSLTIEVKKEQQSRLEAIKQRINNAKSALGIDRKTSPTQNAEAKLQNTGPLLTVHQTSRLVWLVCSYTHINYSSFYPLPSQTSQTSH